MPTKKAEPYRSSCALCGSSHRVLLLMCTYVPYVVPSHRVLLLMCPHVPYVVNNH
jgi:hypothetical protein